MATQPPRTIFLFEYATAGGAWGVWHRPDLVAQLALEGRAMTLSLADDLRRAGYDVWLIQAAHDQIQWRGEVYPNTAENRYALFHRACSAADAVWLIAPEIDFIYWQLTRTAELRGANLLSPHSAFIALTQDKHATAEWLRERGVPAPAGLAFETYEELPSGETQGWVVKPRLGAGSVGVRRAIGGGSQKVESSYTNLWNDGCNPLPVIPGGWRAEAYCQGEPVGVAAVCDGQRALLCPPCRQERTAENEFIHQGWWGPCPEVHDRAHALVQQALGALPPTRGYIGLDLILSDQGRERNGWVVEVNPRLTTSYLCLRQRYEGNLAETMMKFWCGESVTWRWKEEFVKVSTDDLRVWAGTDGR